MEAYREVTPQLTFSGPTCFAPIIRQACKIVQATHKVDIGHHLMLLLHFMRTYEILIFFFYCTSPSVTVPRSTHRGGWSGEQGEGNPRCGD